MRDYYILRDGERAGPYNVIDLSEIKITPETSVWSYEKNMWLPAKSFSGLIYLFEPEKFKGTIDNYFGYNLASPLRRFLADLIMGFASALIYTLFLLPIAVLGTKGIKGPFVTVLNIILALAGFAAVFVFRFIFYPKFSGNLGHKIFGMKVITEEGEDYNKITGGMFREGLKLVTTQFVVPVIWLLWDDNNQNLYDKIVKTYVVKVNK